MNDFIEEQFATLWDATEGYLIREKKRRTFEACAYMLDRTQEMFKWTGLPDTIPQKNLELILQTCGNACVTKVNGQLYAFFGGLGGVPNVYYEPTIYTISNPALNYSAMLEIGKECVRVRNDTIGMGLTPLNMKYAHLLNENEISLRVLDVNYRIRNLISAADDRTFESAQEFLADIEDGKLGVISEDTFFDGLRNSPTGNTGENIKDLIEYEQYLKATWFNELGINANYNMKRERILSDEAGLNDSALMPLVENMLKCREEACEEVNSLYGTEISVELSGPWKVERKELYEVEDFNNSTEDSDIEDESEETDKQDQYEDNIEENVDQEENGMEDAGDDEGDPVNEDNETDPGEDIQNNIDIDINIEQNTEGGKNDESENIETSNNME